MQGKDSSSVDQPLLDQSSLDQSLLDLVRNCGSLNELFQRAAAQQRAATTALLQSNSDSVSLATLATDAATRQAHAVKGSPLAILHQCQAGCSLCCQTVAVDVTPLEALVVAEYLQQKFTAEELRPIQQRLRIATNLRQGMTAEQRRAARIPCALLNESKLCSVYSVRPLACAGFFSLSVAACQKAYAHDQLVDQSVPADPVTKIWTHGISGGLQHAIVHAGLDANLYELNSAVLCALETTNAAKRWLAAEDIFANAVCTDPHSPPRRIAPAPRASAA